MKIVFIRMNFLFSLDKETKSKLYLTFRNAHKSTKIEEYKLKYKIHDSFRFNGFDILFYGDGEIECGSNSYVGGYSTLQSGAGCKIAIGENCSISHNVRIYTTTNVSDQDFMSSEKRKKSGNVIIGNGVWIGANVLINPDVIIGNNSIIGANSVVTKNVEPNSIYGNVPAKILRLKKVE